MKSFFNENKKAFAIWILWMFICFTFWILSSKEDNAEVFVVTSIQTFYYYPIWKFWDFQETFILGLGPMVVYLTLRVVFKKSK